MEKAKYKITSSTRGKFVALHKKKQKRTSGLNVTQKTNNNYTHNQYSDPQFPSQHQHI